MKKPSREELQTQIQYLLTEKLAAAEERALLLERERAAARRVEAVIESISDAFFAVDREWRLTYLNGQAKRLFQVPREKVLGRNLRKILEKRGDQESLQRIQSALTGEEVCYELYYPERRFWLQVRLYPSEEGVSVYCRDVTSLVEDRRRREKVEKELRISHARYQSLFENATDVIFICDGTGRLKSVNRRATEVTGYSREELLSMNLLDLTAPSSAGHASQLLKRFEVAPEFNVVDLVEVELVRKDGKHRALEVGAGVLQRSADGIEIQGIARDVTEQKVFRTQIHHAQKMELLGQLAGGVAHDFNNFLTAIAGFAHVARSSLPRGSQTACDLKEITKLCKRAGGLIKHLLTFSSRHSCSPVPTNLNKRIQDSLPMVHRLLGPDHHLVFEPGETVGETLIDPVQFDQILMNLVVNARDAMPGEGRLTIRTEGIPLGSTGTGVSLADLQDHVMLSVGDTGKGMDESVREHIFEPFFSTKENGTGLGLSTVSGIVKQHGGEIVVESEVGEGATIRLYFPVTKPRCSRAARITLTRQCD